MSLGVTHEARRMLSLASDRSEGGRAQLAKTMVSVSIESARALSVGEQSMMSDILCRLIASVEHGIRHELARELSRAPDVLPGVVNLLANDEIEIARPILEHSGILDDPMLVEIAQRRSDEHRLAIAARARIEEPVTDALIEHGGEDVIAAVIGNHGAAISREAMELVVAESRRVDAWRQPLLDRADLPPGLAYQMYWWVSAALRRRILTDFEIDERTLDDAMTRAARNAPPVTDEKSTEGKALALVRRMRQVGELTDDFILQTLRQQKIPLFVAAFAERAGISYELAWRAINHNGFESLIILAKASGMVRNIVSYVVLILASARVNDGVLKLNILERILTTFDRLNLNHCKRVLAYWQQSPELREAIHRIETAERPAPAGGRPRLRIAR